MNTNNPFTTATWGEAYDLAGAKWIPINERASGGAVLIRNNHITAGITNEAHCGDLVIADSPWLIGYDPKSDHDPLLPSPAFVNAQPDPRASGIASLERAGFATRPDLLRIALDSNKPPQSFVLFYLVDLPLDNAPMELEMYTSDRAVARYATDCFAVLSEWASQVKWEEHNETA